MSTANPTRAIGIWPWLAGLVLAGAAHSALALAMFAHPLPPPISAPDGAFVVELADIATSRSQPARNLALGAEARAQPASAPTPPAAKPAPQDTPDPIPQDTPAPAPEPEPSPLQPPQPAARAQPEVTQDTTTHSDATILAAQDRAQTQAAARRQADPQQVAAWMRDLEMALQKAKTYPEAARQARAEGVVTLRIVLLEDGALHSVALAKPSGVATLDTAALDLVVQAAPFPPPPLSAANGQLSLLIPVSYRLR